jgi:hypothetical protein
MDETGIFDPCVDICALAIWTVPGVLGSVSNSPDRIPTALMVGANASASIPKPPLNTFAIDWAPAFSCVNSSIGSTSKGSHKLQSISCRVSFCLN